MSITNNRIGYDAQHLNLRMAASETKLNYWIVPYNFFTKYIL